MDADVDAATIGEDRDAVHAGRSERICGTSALRSRTQVKHIVTLQSLGRQDHTEALPNLINSINHKSK
jgi:hypothetical protein